MKLPKVGKKYKVYEWESGISDKQKHGKFIGSFYVKKVNKNSIGTTPNRFWCWCSKKKNQIALEEFTIWVGDEVKKRR